MANLAKFQLKNHKLNRVWSKVLFYNSLAKLLLFIIVLLKLKAIANLTLYLTIDCKICFSFFQKLLIVETRLKDFLRDINKVRLIKTTLQQLKFK